MLGVSAPNVIHWAAKFKKHGIDGLRDQPKGHRKPILDGQAAEAVRGWIVGAVDAKGRAAHWTLEKLCLAVRGEFGIEIKKSAMANKLKSMKLSVRRPRPFHHKTDEKLKDDFKKNERSRREPCQRRR
jgi:transposase